MSVCHKKQYECCSIYIYTCPLAHLCKQMKGYAEASKVCIKDCPNCTFPGCSMPLDIRKENPIYSDHVLISKRSDQEILRYELEKERDAARRKIEHKKKYSFYNRLWGDTEKIKAYQSQKSKEYYWKHREEILQKKEKKRRAMGIRPKEELQVIVPPPCGGDCLNCSYPECILPENYSDKNAYLRNWKANNKEKVSAWGKKYYKNHKDEVLDRHRAYRIINREKIRERDKRYRESRKEKELLRNKKWREENPEKYRAQRERYNKKRREERAKNRQKVDLSKKSN